MKKWLYLLASVTLLSACTNESNPPENESTQETVVESESSNENQTESETDTESESANETEESTSESESTSQTQSTSEENTDPESGSTSEEETSSESESSSNVENEGAGAQTESVSADQVIETAEEYANQGLFDKADYTLAQYQNNNQGNISAEENEQFNQMRDSMVQAKADRVRETQSEAPAYIEVRESSVRRDEYQEDTGESIDQANDQEISTWLQEKETQKSQPQTEENTEASEASESSEQTSTSEEQAPTEFELENYALDQVVSQTNNYNSDYIYFAEAQEESWVAVEIREQQTDGATTWTNLIGMYRYNVETGELLTFDPITAEYQ